MHLLRMHKHYRHKSQTVNYQQHQQQQQRGQEAELYRQQQQRPDQLPNQQRRRRGGRLLKGSASSVRGLAAAKYIVDKAVSVSYTHLPSPRDS